MHIVHHVSRYNPPMENTDVTTADAPSTPHVLDRPRDIPLWRNINFELMWTSIAASGFGDRLVQMTAFLFLGIAASADAAPIQAGVMMFFFLPYMIFGPIGGIISDRFPRKWILFTCDEARGLILLIGAILIWKLTPAGYMGEAIPEDHKYYDIGTWSIYGIIMVTGSFAAVFGTARDAMTPQIVPLRNLQAANAIILAIASIAGMIGLGVGGKIIEGYGVLIAIIIAALCYLITGSFWAFVKPVQHTTILPEAQRPKRTLAQVFKYVGQHRRIMMLFLIVFLFWGLASVFLAVLAATVKSPDYFNYPQEKVLSHIGYIQMTVGIGMLTSSVILMVVRDLRHTPKLIFAGLGMTGVMLLLFWMNNNWLLGSSWVLGLIFAGGVGFFSNFARVGADTLTQAISANYIRGRVFGIREILTNGAVVTVNVFIWRMPKADERMIILLPVMALILLGIGLAGFWYVRHTGPKKRLAAKATSVAPVA